MTSTYLSLVKNFGRTLARANAKLKLCPIDAQTTSCQLEKRYQMGSVQVFL
ncbi:hypothetical protein [Nostoc sp. ChiQUE01b]|uniref:hypothetical protein n=1 Tax=Nostoc sp. ChiQUE01b TaxID=3075376 RepID=UPI002AD5782B|nr:hypothetical protein [Nostoc sp. ChiQUE01b]MDZ8262870.1 hypothetical protein [Nostoc sp. ChiQUE01b]